MRDPHVPFFVAVGREGDASCVLVTVWPVCQPSLVLPPLFDSNLVELFNHTGVRHAYYILKYPFSFLPQYSLWRCRRQINRYFKNLAIGERSMKALVPLLACTSESFYCWFVELLILRNSHVRRKGRTPRRTSKYHEPSLVIAERCLRTMKENDARWQQN